MKIQKLVRSNKTKISFKELELYFLMKDDIQLTTPKIPVRLSSSITNLISSCDDGLAPSMLKDNSPSSSKPQTINSKRTSLNLGENNEVNKCS